MHVIIQSPYWGAGCRLAFWELLRVEEDTGGTSRGLVSGGVLHSTTEDAPPLCVSLGPSGPKTLLRVWKRELVYRLRLISSSVLGLNGRSLEL